MASIAATPTAVAPEHDPQFDHELNLVESSIALVAAGAARRVTINQLRFGEQILPMAQSSAREHGLVARALWHVQDDGCDIAVEPGG
jgi:hypothetical protein